MTTHVPFVLRLLIVLVAWAVGWAVPAVAVPGEPPDAVEVLTPDQTVDPGETITYDVAATGVDEPATAEFSGDGVSATVLRVRSDKLRMSVTADATASPGWRDLTVFNPDGLSDTLADALLVTGDALPVTGEVVGRVFEDADGDGVEDVGEVGLVGVVVTVAGEGGGEVVSSTDEAGDFVVAGVEVGEATVVVSGPAGFVATTGNEVQVVTVFEDTMVVADPVGYQVQALPGVYTVADVHLLLDARLLALTDGDPVSSWVDEAAGFDFMVPDSGDAPTYVATAGFEGKPSVEFDGEDDVLEAAFGELNTNDFAFHLVIETMGYASRTAIVSRHGAGAADTKHAIGYDDFDEHGSLRGEPSWVTMSGPDGNQAQHYHPILSPLAGDDRASPTADFADGANRVVLTYVVRDSGQVRFWDRLDDLLDETMGPAGNDLADGLRLGGREDGTAHANFRLAYLLVVDEANYSEADLLAAAADLGAWFDVPGFDTG